MRNQWSDGVGPEHPETTSNTILFHVVIPPKVNVEGEMLCRVNQAKCVASAAIDSLLGIVRDSAFWGEWGTIAVGSTRRRLSFFLMVLCYSRLMYLEFTVSQKMEFFLACHENAFAAFALRTFTPIYFVSIRGPAAPLPLHNRPKPSSAAVCSMPRFDHLQSLGLRKTLRVERQVTDPKPAARFCLKAALLSAKPPPESMPQPVR
jgi:hypothetical protein